MASGDLIFTIAPEFSLVSENETDQNSTTVVLKGFAGFAADAVTLTMTTRNDKVGWPVGEAPFKYGKTYSLVITEN